MNAFHCLVPNQAVLNLSEREQRLLNWQSSYAASSPTTPSVNFWPDNTMGMIEEPRNRGTEEPRKRRSYHLSVL